MSRDGHDVSLDLEIRQIRDSDRLTGLKLGEGFTALKTFIQRHAKSFQSSSLARTYAAFNSADTPRVAGYITLLCGEIALEAADRSLLSDEGLAYRYRSYPAVKIARLAVDSRMRGLGLGRRLVELALGTAKDIISPAVGCRFMVVDSKPTAVAFYESCGFTLLDTPGNRERSEPMMFVDLHRAAT